MLFAVQSREMRFPECAVYLLFIGTVKKNTFNTRACIRTKQ